MNLTQGLLNRISDMLNRDATNYTVFLRLYELSERYGVDDLSACIREAFGESAEVENEEGISVDDILVEMDELLSYAGDSGAGPSDSVLNSREFQGGLVELKDCTLSLAKQADAVKKFCFRAGHPAYPVFWDFAYAFFADGKVSILIGSSSD
jgi:hypothetical protein